MSYAALQKLRKHELVNNIRGQCTLKKGLGCYKALAVVFRKMDTDMSKQIDKIEFSRGMMAFGIKMTSVNLGKVFDMCDTNNSNTIDFREFMDILQPDLPECRKDVICEVFDHLDMVKDGMLKTDDVVLIYKNYSMNHPKVASGEWTKEQAYSSFLESFDDPNPELRDGMVSEEEFISYYTQVSSTVDDDAYFDMMMRSCWGLMQKKTINK